MSILKNNLFVSFYADDMRFFYSISKVIPFKSYFYSIFTSGIFYLLFKFKLPLNFIFNFKSNISLPASFEDLISYEKTQNKFNTSHLITASQNYIFLFDYIIKKKNIKYVYLSGDSRLIIKSAEYAAKFNSCSIIYFEQGPFGTTILDTKGVNANCSFRIVNFTEDLSSIKINKSKKVTWTKYFRISDLLFYNLLKYKSKYLFNDLPSFFNKKTNKIIKQKNNYILLILQVPKDANMILHSPNFSNHLDILKWTFQNLPLGIDLVVREHPNFIGSYEKELYNFIKTNDNIISLDNSDLNTSINNSILVVVNNSTVGIEAILQNKKLVVLGDCYYDKIKSVFKFENNKSNILKKAINSKIDNKTGISFINYVLKNELIGFHFRDENLNISDEILLRKIKNYYY